MQEEIERTVRNEQDENKALPVYMGHLKDKNNAKNQQ